MAGTVVLYHESCMDGFGAAYSAWKVFGDGAQYIPVQYGSRPPEAAQDCQKLYILDFCYPKGVLLDLARKAKGTVVLDHHETARVHLEGFTGGQEPNLFVEFDNSKSGAVLAWEYFFPDTTVPLLIQYIQDRDLWSWKLPASREVSAWLSIVRRDFKVFDEHLLDFQEDEILRSHWIEQGSAVLEAKNQNVISLASKAHWVYIAGHRVPAVNSPIFQSEIGERLCQIYPEAPFSAVFFSLDQNTDIWSLRSRGDFDVSLVAKALGGGGHPAASGFRHVRGNSFSVEP